MAVSKTEIAGTQGREPVGVVLSCGIKKGGTGFPVEKEHYHLVVPREENNHRPHHPAFASYNAAASEKRRTIRGNLVHASKADCYEGYLRKQTGPQQIGMHPNRRPFCVGDGIHAMRWMGDDAENFTEIKCPNERCEYRLSTPPSCKPFTRLLFQLRWQDGVQLPRMLCKFTSGGWYTYLNIKGFFDYVENVAQQLGLKQYTLFGYPFTLTLTQQTKPSSKTRFPVTAITPEIDPVEFFGHQAVQLEQLRSVQYEAITGPGQQAADIEYSDVKQLGIGSHD